VARKKKPSTFAECYQRAAIELKMPPRGKKGSRENKMRQWMGATVYRRALDIARENGLVPKLGPA
jgi:hypothetical protein